MAYSEELAARVRSILSFGPPIQERKMFGGLAFLVDGNMACGVLDERLMIRVPRDEYESALGEPHVHVMDFTGRPMRGFVYLDAEGIRTDEELSRWVRRGIDFASSLPPK